MPLSSPANKPIAGHKPASNFASLLSLVDGHTDSSCRQCCGATQSSIPANTWVGGNLACSACRRLGKAAAEHLETELKACAEARKVQADGLFEPAEEHRRSFFTFNNKHGHYTLQPIPQRSLGPNARCNCNCSSSTLNSKLSTLNSKLNLTKPSNFMGTTSL